MKQIKQAYRIHECISIYKNGGLMMEKKTISVQTPLGELMAEIGGDPYDYPEIFVYLKRKDGIEIDLVCASMNKDNNEMHAFLYGDTSTTDWTKKYSWTEKELNVEVE